MQSGEIRPPSFDERLYRDALGRFPTGVVVVSTIGNCGEWLGITVSSFNSVSLTPPLVLFSISRHAISFQAWRKVDRFVINVLNEDQEELSNRFAQSKGEKWNGINRMTTRSGLPMIWVVRFQLLLRLLAHDYKERWAALCEPQFFISCRDTP
jgi:flavin reductase (DIM6/NTAB) family NADH-FMN oxidoreductase RutF